MQVILKGSVWYIYPSYLESEINPEDRVAEFHFVLVPQFLQGRVFPRKVPQGSLSFPKVKVIQEMLLIEGSA